MIKNAYYRGFAQKCAELGVDPRKLLKLASMQKKAEGEMSVKEIYPWASRDLEYLQALALDKNTDHGTRDLFRKYTTMTPEEFSAKEFRNAAAFNASDAFSRGGGLSLDHSVHPAFDFLRDPRFMSETGITPAGTNLLNSVPQAMGGNINWNNVDKLTGVGRGYGGRNIPLPEGFLHKSAPTNSTLEAVAPEIFAQPKK